MQGIRSNDITVRYIYQYISQISDRSHKQYRTYPISHFKNGCNAIVR